MRYAGLNLFRLQVFVAVVERGGYSAAAAQLNLGQPSVSFHVKALEGLLGARLLVYRDRKVHLTPEGEELYRTARAMLRDGERLASAIQQLRAGQEGQLQLGASMAFEQPAFFERLVGPFFRAHPRVQLSVRFGHSTKLAEAVANHELDLAYVQTWHLPAGVHYEPLHRADFVFMVGAGHPLAHKEIATAAEIYEAGIIAAPQDSIEWFNYRELLRASGLDRVRIGLQVDGIQARVLAARAGLGVLGLFVLPYAEPSVFAPLRQLRLPGPTASAEFGLASREGDLPGPAMQEFSGWLRQVVGAPSAPEERS